MFRDTHTNFLTERRIITVLKHWQRLIRVCIDIHWSFAILNCIYESHCGCLMRCRNLLSLSSSWVHPRFLAGSVLLIFLVFCVILLCVFTLRFPHTNYVRFVYFQLFLVVRMSYLRYLCWLIVVCTTYCIIFFVLLTVPLPSNWHNPIRCHIQMNSWSSNKNTTSKVFEHF
jgi:hypothetical protein